MNNEFLVDVSENDSTDIKLNTVGSRYELVLADEAFGKIQINLNFNQLDNAIDEMRRYNCEPTFEELENDLDAAKEEIKELENDFNSLRERYRK
ncbi:hypothetical protein P5E50_11520 [Clostridium perfringens]|uniref:hypothetical protein n=1 Tax=Clostridium perfringens TaxID=1502 RepID=UPI002A301048|nr:hypothetical protein [Clostridium perfringens]